MMTWLIALGGTLVLALVIAGLLATWYKKVETRGKALIINGKTKVTASLTGGIVYPIINTHEYMDITRKKISIERRGQRGESGEEYEGLHCKDNIRADLKVDFYIGVNPTEEDILKVAEHSVKNVGDTTYLKGYFTPKFSEALKTAVKQFEFEDLLTNREQFREAVKKVIGNDLDGFKLYDVVIDKVDQTALEAHDNNNVLDVEGIRKIAERTSHKNIETNEIRQDEETKIKHKNVSAIEARLQLDKQQKEAEAKQQREVAVIQAQEEALATEKREEERLRTESARIKTDERVAIEEENKSREIEIARINNERVTKIEQEKVNRAKETERVQTEREVAVREMEKEKAVEEQKKEVADTKSVRVQIERKIATEEEETENLRVRESANRDKLVVITNAEAEAEAKKTREVTDAISHRESAEHEAEVTRVKAAADYDRDEKQAASRERLAEAHRAEIAADGLARSAVEKDMAEAIQLKGEAEAHAIRERGIAEAAGEEAKYKAMATIDDKTREHDQFKLNLEKDKSIELEGLKTQAETARENANVLSAALGNADMQIIGDNAIFGQIRDAMVSGKSIDKRFDNSTVLNSLVGKYRDGEGDLPQDLKELLQKSEMSTGDVGTLTLASLARQFLSTNEGQSFLNQLKGGNASKGE